MWILYNIVYIPQDLSTKKGYRLVGDVCYEEARQVASMITPVPGGVGPMTIAMLLSNTLDAAKRTYGLAEWPFLGLDFLLLWFGI